MRLVTTGTTPQRAQMWKSAVLVPNAYIERAERSFTVTCNEPCGWDVHTPPCFTQNVQPQARAGISTGSGSHASENKMFPQWQLPVIK